MAIINKIRVNGTDYDVGASSQTFFHEQTVSAADWASLAGSGAPYYVDLTSSDMPQFENATYDNVQIFVDLNLNGTALDIDSEIVMLQDYSQIYKATAITSGSGGAIRLWAYNTPSGNLPIICSWSM